MAEIKKINVDGVDYDIVSESAERKIAELEKNNTALASVSIGTRDDSSDYIKVGLGADPGTPDVADVMIGRGVRIGKNVVIGSQYPVLMEWDNMGNFTVRSDGGNRAPITLGPNANITPGGSGNISKDIKVLGSGTISIYDSVLEVNPNILTFGMGNAVSMSMYGDMFRVQTSDGSTDLRVASERDFVLRMGSNMPLAIDGPSGGLVNIGPGVYIGTALTGESLEIKGPVYLKAETENLIIGTGGLGMINIFWGESDKIIFTNLMTGKKATLTLS